MRRIMGKIVCWALLAVLLIAPALAEWQVYVDQDGESYRGVWRSLPALDAVFLLPEGWVGNAYDTVYEGSEEAFYGASGDGSVRLIVTLFDTYSDSEYDDDYHGQTGEDFLEYVHAVFAPSGSTYLTEANGREAVLYRNDSNDPNYPVYVRVLLPDKGKRVICFAFNCKTPDDLSDAFALAIAGSTVGREELEALPESQGREGTK